MHASLRPVRSLGSKAGGGGGGGGGMGQGMELATPPPYHTVGQNGTSLIRSFSTLFRVREST